MTTAAIQQRATPARRPAPRPRGEPPTPHGLGFGLFVLVNAVLFVRPADVVPALEGIELYQFAILACLAVSFPAILEHANRGLDKRPIDVCVLLMLPVVCISHIGGGRPEQMFEDGFFFFKIVVYYLLFVSLVTTPARLRAFCGWVILFSCAVAILAALDFHQVIRLPRGLDRWGRPAVEDVTRMYGPGIFQDPNDVCVLIVSAVMLLLGRLGDTKAGVLRWGWLVPLAVFAYGFYLTRSRGGMLAFMAGLAVLGGLTWGWRPTFLLGLLVGPLMVGAMIMTREMDMSSHGDTGQTRIQLWNEGMVMFRASPLFGVGMNNYHLEAGQVAHNSYMHAFAELGFVGGVLFFGATWLALAGLLTLREGFRRINDPAMGQVYPAVAACVAAWAAGMFSLTLNYLVVTYTFLGMAGMVLSTAVTSPPRQAEQAGTGLWARLAGLSLVFLVFMFVLIRLLFRA